MAGRRRNPYARYKRRCAVCGKAHKFHCTTARRRKNPSKKYKRRCAVCGKSHKFHCTLQGRGRRRNPRGYVAAGRKARRDRYGRFAR